MRRGKVCQRRLAAFRNRASLDEHLPRLVPAAEPQRRPRLAEPAHAAARGRGGSGASWAQEQQAIELEQQGLLEQSLSHYSRRLSLVQGGRTPLSAVGLLQRPGRCQQAMEHFNRALKAEPQLSPLYWREYAERWVETPSRWPT